MLFIYFIKNLMTLSHPLLLQHRLASRAGTTYNYRHSKRGRLDQVSIGTMALRTPSRKTNRENA